MLAVGNFCSEPGSQCEIGFHRGAKLARVSSKELLNGRNLLTSRVLWLRFPAFQDPSHDCFTIKALLTLVEEQCSSLRVMTPLMEGRGPPMEIPDPSSALKTTRFEGPKTIETQGKRKGTPILRNPHVSRNRSQLR